MKTTEKKGVGGARGRNPAQGFTLIELLVVIALVGLMLAVFSPIVMNAAAAGRATHSASNLRQWGIALNTYLDDHAGLFPLDGKDNVGANLGLDNWWANALPPYLGSDPYRELVADGRAPLPPAHSIFLDPAARVPGDAPYRSGSMQFFFCYVPNSKLNSSLSGGARVRVAGISQPAATAFMIEKRTHPNELPTSDPFYSKSLDRAKADWQRFANRHRKGGHILFADGHVEHVTNKKATTQTRGDYNQGDLIWNPFGVAK